MARSSKSAKVELTADTRILALHGDEAAIQKEHLDALRAALKKAHGDVDTYDFDGKTATLADVFDELRGYSLMGGYKVVVVDPADDWISAQRDRGALERYVANPVDHATLVLRCKGWKSTAKIEKAIAKGHAVIKCEPPRPAEAVTRLVARAKKQHGLVLEKPAAQLLVDRVGVHLVRLETEVDKLAAMAGGAGDAVIDRALVERAVEKGNEEKAWAVQGPVLQALLDGGGAGGRAARSPGGAALEKVRELIDRGGQPEVLVTYAVTDLARKLAVGARMLAAGEGEARISQELRLWGPEKGLTLRAIRVLGHRTVFGGPGPGPDDRRAEQVGLRHHAAKPGVPVRESGRAGVSLGLSTFECGAPGGR